MIKKILDNKIILITIFLISCFWYYSFIPIEPHINESPTVFAFGNSEGIDWINEDGSCNKDIFIRKKFFPPNRITVTNIMNKITEKKGK